MATFDPRFLAVILLLTAATANAQVHISSIRGDVSIRHGDTGPQAAALVNAPLQPDDRILTSPNSRVDVQFDSVNTFRIAANTELHLLAPASGKYQTELIKGDLTYSAAGPTPNVTVDTPSVSVRPADEGVYRIAVNAARESEITVRAGQAEIFAASGSEWISAGQKMIARGSPADPEFKIMSAVSRWRRAARVLLSSVQVNQTVSSSSSDDRSSYKEKDRDKDHSAPKPASKTTPVTASNGASKPTPTRGTFSPSPSSTHAAASTSSSHSASVSSTHSASTQTASNSSSHSAPASSDHSSSSSSSNSHK
jgi:hypothetical protein